MNRSIKLGLIITLAVALVSVRCGRNSSGNDSIAARDTVGTAFIKFKELEHDFGVIKQGEQVGHIFSFTNTGDADLIILNTTVGCGCTITKYDKKPVSPGKSGSVEVSFNSSGRSGKQTKTLVVISNAENKLVILRINADVKTEETNK